MPSWDEEQRARVAQETAAGKKIMGAALSTQTREQLLDATCLWWWRFTEQAKINAALEAAKQSAEVARDAAEAELRQLTPSTPPSKRRRRRIRTTQQALRAITETTDRILAGEIDPLQARAAIYALQTCLVAMKMLKPGNAGTVPELHAMDDEQG